jgi:TetR/AcrR family transcriptional regulator, transcriptional repressor for nem operon
MDAAERFTQTRGFNAFSYKDLQPEVGVKTSSIHYYFPTKQNLATALAERYIKRFFEVLDEIDRKHKSPAVRLKAMGQIFIDVAAEDKLCLCNMLAADLLSMPAEGMEALRGFFEKAEKWIAKTITEGVEAGELQSLVRPRHMAAYILAALEGGLLIARTRKDVGYVRAVLDQALAQLKK